MFGFTSSGTWWLRSEIDNRWNVEGKSEVGSFEMPDECRDKLEELKRKLGEPPSDLIWGYMKD